MSSFTDYLENAVLDHVFRNTSLTSPTTVYAAAYTVAPTDSTSGTEVTNANAYARTAITMGAASLGSMSNSSAVTFPTASGGNWGDIVAIGITDSATHGGGNILAYDGVTTTTINDGDTLQINSGELTISLT